MLRCKVIINNAFNVAANTSYNSLPSPGPTRADKPIEPSIEAIVEGGYVNKEEKTRETCRITRRKSGGSEQELRMLPALIMRLNITGPGSSTVPTQSSKDSTTISCTSPNARETPFQSLLPEVDRMPPTYANPETSGSPLASTRYGITRAEERRLLGGSGRSGNADAVPIGLPQTRITSRMSGVKILGGGPRPRNTLNGNPQAPRLKPQGNQKPRGGALNTLDIGISRGSNVESMPHAIKSDHFAMPSPKRQKTTHQPSSPSSPLSMDDPLDDMPPESISFTGLCQRTSQTPSVHSQGSGVGTRRSVSATGSLVEHRSVERMMDSRPPTKKAIRRNNGQSQQRNHGLPVTSSPTSPIDISVDDGASMHSKLPTASRVSYQGTMDTGSSTGRVNVSKSLQVASTWTQSPFFPGSNSAHSQIKQSPARSTTVNVDRGQSERLANQFVSVDGLRRSSDVNMSMSSDVDELQKWGDTVPHLADTSSSMRSRQSSPSKASTSTLKPTSSAELSEGLPESNIKPTTFVKAEPNVRNDVREMNGKLREKTPWAIDVAAISHGNELIEQANISLVFNDQNKFYSVVSNGNTTSLRIQPDKLRKIFWGSSGGKVRFSSSKIGNEDNILDIEFRTEKDVSNVVMRLQDQSGATAQSHSSEYMDKIFRKKREDYRKSTRSAPDFWQSRESRKQTPSTTIEPTRQRTGRSVVDELCGRAGLVDDTAPTDREKRPVSRILDGLIRPQEQNNHLRRLTRSSVATSKPTDDVFSAYDDVAPTQKYSIVHGLGDPWKRPLTFPRNGKKKTTIEWSDLERLDEGEFLNDNLISFYLRLLEQNLTEQKPNISKSVYFFNTYFFATLTNTHKGKKCFNYEGVQKWTRAVDLFTYDYIIVPINESSHWYLAIICNLPALDRNPDLGEETPGSPMEGDNPVVRKSNGFAPLSCSSAEEPAQEGDTTPREESKELGEREARNSFAEMRLDNDEILLALDHTDSREQRPVQVAGQDDGYEEDQEMLDQDLEYKRTGPMSPRLLDFLETKALMLAEGREGLMEGLNQRLKASPKSKRQKRKSIPPAITRRDPGKPAILLFDSLGASRGTTTKILKDYLHEEARTKRGGMEFDRRQIQGINAKVPQQNNFSDCGLFLLGYVAKFLEDDPKDFITKIIRQEFDEKKDWAKLVPSTLRANIRDQLQELHKIQEDERQSAKKASKFSDKKGQKPELSPTLTSNSKFKAADNEVCKAEGMVASKPAEHVLSNPPEIAEASLGVIPARPPYDFDGNSSRLGFECDKADKFTEQCMEQTEKEIEAATAVINLGRARTTAFAKNDVGLDSPPTARNEPIIVDSQSQNYLSTPRSTRDTSPIAGSQGRRDGSRLPSEIPDSQPSAPSRFTEYKSPVPSDELRNHTSRPDPQPAAPAKTNVEKGTPQRLKEHNPPHRSSETSKGFEAILRRESPKPPIASKPPTTSTSPAVAVEIPVQTSAGRRSNYNNRAKRRKPTKSSLELTGVEVIGDVINVDDD